MNRLDCSREKATQLVNNEAVSCWDVWVEADDGLAFWAIFHD